MIGLFRKRSGGSSDKPEIDRPDVRLPEGLRIYAIGDVHGRLDLLDGVFGRIDRHLEADPCEQNLTILLGDMIDRGPQSRGVIERVMARGKSHWLLAMRGNHEQCLLDFLEDPEVLVEWGEFGAFSTLLSYGVKPRLSATPEQRREARDDLLAVMPAEQLAFLKQLAISFSCHGYFFVHAGVRPLVPFKDQVAEDLLWIRHEFLSHRGGFERIVVHGHTPVSEPEILPNRINLDTGAYATGRLTCVVMEGNEVALL